MADSSMATAATHNVHDTIVELPAGQRSTMNNTGFEMSECSPLHAVWVESFDGEHPLLDIGCAFGRNSIAAATMLTKQHGPPAVDGAPRVVAMDCDAGHLQHVDSIGMPGVQTVAGRLPDVIPRDALAAYGGVSSVLCSEVVHFLSAEALEATLREIHALLIPGGTLCITVASPDMNAMPDEKGECPLFGHIREVHASRAAAGEQYPGDGFNLREVAQKAFTATGRDWSAGGGVNRLPTYFHALTPEVLSRACATAGFEVRVARAGWHPGYPPVYMNPALKGRKENTQIIAVKPPRPASA